MKINRNLIIYFFLFFTLFVIEKQLRANEIGKIIQLTGKVQRIALTSGERLPIDQGSMFKIGEIFMTDENASLSLLLKNNTILQMKKNTKISITNLRVKKSDPPTTITIEYGKLHISCPYYFEDKSLVVSTPTAVISLVFGDLAIIAAEKETKVLIYKNKIGVANRKIEFRTAYIVYPGEEISIKQNHPPSSAKKVRLSIMDWWLDFYKITDKNQNIIRVDKDNGIIDWLLRKRDF